MGESPLPRDLPEVSGRSVWTAADLAADAPWVEEFTPEEIAELETVAAASATQTPLADVVWPDADDGPMGSKLDGIRAELLSGRGFTMLRGLPVDEYSLGQASRILALIGVALGSLRRQNAAGDLVGHVRDIGADVDDPNTRIYQTHERQTFHTDSSDVVGLLCLRTARSGGASLLASAGAIYEEMRRTRPDLARRLFDPVATDRRGEVPPGQKPWFEIPVLSWYDGRLTVLYQRQYIDSAARFEEAPRLDEEHRAALDVFDSLADDPRFHVSIDFRPGDIQFVHNHSLLHDRTSFDDWPEPERRRHLLRLWISMPGDRQLPPVFAQRYGSVEVGHRGGIVVAEV